MAVPTDAVLAEVERLFAEGEAHLDEGEDEEALACFQAAWHLLPDPKDEQDSASRLLAAVGDCHFFLGHWEASYRTFQRLVQGWGDMLENPYIRLRLGQSLFEMGDLSEALNWMMFAYLSEGTKLF